jgi:hypothetical protein
MWTLGIKQVEDKINSTSSEIPSLSTHPSIYLSVYLSIHPSIIYLPIYPSIYLSISLSGGSWVWTQGFALARQGLQAGVRHHTQFFLLRCSLADFLPELAFSNPLESQAWTISSRLALDGLNLDQASSISAYMHACAYTSLMRKIISEVFEVMPLH